MTATEYYPYFDTGTFRINERTLPKVFEMYYCYLQQEAYESNGDLFFIIVGQSLG